MAKKSISEFYKAYLFCGKYAANHNTLYRCNDAFHYYQKIGKQDIQMVLCSDIHEEARDEISIGMINEIHARLLRDPRLQKDFGLIRKKNQHLVHTLNGVYNVDTGEFIERPDYADQFEFDYVLNFNYIPDADITEAKSWHTLLNTSLEIAKYPGKEKFVYQIIAYLLCRFLSAEKAVILYGDSGCGKSVMCSLIESAFRPDDMFDFKLDSLGNANYRIMLRNTSLTICREIPMAPIKHIDIFKSLITSEKISGEAKYEMAVTFAPYCKVLMAGNTLPNFKEVDDTGNESMIRRFVVLPFKKVHTNRNNYLTEELIREKDIIFSYALSYLKELVASGFEFSLSEDSKEILNRYKEEQDMLPLFVSECCMTGEEHRIHNRDLLKAVRRFYAENGFNCLMSSRQIINKISELSGGTRARFRINKSAPLWGIQGIALRDSESITSCKIRTKNTKTKGETL